VKQECLSQLILFGEGSLRRALQQFTAHYHAERNHQRKEQPLAVPRRAGQTKDPCAASDSLQGAAWRASEVLSPPCRLSILTTRGCGPKFCSMNYSSKVDEYNKQVHGIEKKDYSELVEKLVSLK
jgi:hypothetical protein